MAEPRQPQDRKSKQEKPPEPDEFFSFTFKGEQYVMPHKTLDVITPGVLRRNRHLAPDDQGWTLLEKLADDDETILALFDQPGRETHVEFNRIAAELGKHLGASLGE